MGRADTTTSARQNAVGAVEQGKRDIVMIKMINLPSNSVRAFCISELSWGSPLSFTSKYEDGFPIVELYNGDNFCGVSESTVCSIDDRKFSEVPTGGLIYVCPSWGNYQVRLPRKLFKNPEKIGFGKFIKPIVGGWKVSAKKSKKCVAVIESFNDTVIEVRMI
jgi:hypothetical protein